MVDQQTGTSVMMESAEKLLLSCCSSTLVGIAKAVNVIKAHHMEWTQGNDGFEELEGLSPPKLLYHDLQSFRQRGVGDPDQLCF